MNTKQTLKGIAITAFSIGMYFAGNNLGYNSGLTDGVETTKQEIRRSVVDLRNKTIKREEEAQNIEYGWKHDTKEYTYAQAHGFEKRAFGDCNREISDVIDYRIDNLTKEDIVKRIEFDKQYKSYNQ